MYFLYVCELLHLAEDFRFGCLSRARATFLLLSLSVSLQTFSVCEFSPKIDDEKNAEKIVYFILPHPPPEQCE